jgi:uncharacterized membrane protein
VEPHAPSPDGNRVYGRIAELAAAAGPVGRAVAVSIVAYLLGSLVQASFRYGWSRVTRDLGPIRLDEEQQELFDSLAAQKGPLGIQTILEIANPLHDASIKRPFMKDLTIQVWEIADRELMESFRQLRFSVNAIQNREEGSANCFFGMHARMPVVRLTIQKQGIRSQREYVVPHFLPVTDLLGQINLLETRLLEVAEGTGAKVERLQAEAEFRLAIVPPLVLLIAILAFGVNLFWLAALIIPFALAVQGIDLYQSRVEEVLDALRARMQTQELERITPVFERYRALATHLLEGLDGATWPSGKSS